MIKKSIRESYDNISLDKDSKHEMLTRILESAGKAAGRKRRPWAAAVMLSAAAVVAAVIISLALWGGADKGAGNNVAAVSSTPPKETQAIPVAENKDYATVIQMSLNPNVEIRLDAQGVVTEVVGLNDDGTALIEGIDFAGMSLENATIMIVNQLILQGYITAAEIQEEINISLSSDTMTLDTLSVMTNIIETAAAQQNIAVDVIQNAETNTMQIVLEGEGEPDVWPELPPEGEEGSEPVQTETGLQMEFLMVGGTHSAYVDNVLIHTAEGETIENLQDFAGTRLNQAALRSILELLDKGYITDSEGSKAVRFYFTGDCKDSDVEGVATLTQLLLAEYNMKLAVTTNAGEKEILLTPDETIMYEEQTSKYNMCDVLNYMVNKDEADLSPRQVAILKLAFNYREYQRLLEKRYYVLIPDLVGLPEQQAVDMLLNLGIPPAVVREKVPGYDPKEENGGFPVPTAYTEGDEPPMQQGPVWEFPVVDFGCVFYQDGPAGTPCQAGMYIQINVVVPMDDERPETTDYREDSGIVLREMDVPFDISGYPDTFSLSDAEGFGAMIKEMNATYVIENKDDYTVTIDRNTGWENTAVITIAHKDGFPLSKFFVQDGRIIEHEFLWRRGAPTAEDMG